MSAIKFISHFVPDQLCRTPPAPTTSFHGQTVIVTGSNTGLGKDAARQIVALGASKVVLAVRNLDKGQAAKHDIEKATGRQNVIEVWPLDLSSYQSVKAFAARCDSSLTRLDAVIENAGLWATDFRKAENHEISLTVNVISTFLLAHLLLPKLRESARLFQIRPRLTIVSSDLFEIAPLKARNEPRILDAMSDVDKADMENRYADSKLLEVLYLRALFSHQNRSASQASPITSTTGGNSNGNDNGNGNGDTEKKNKTSSDVIINIVNPGLCRSELSRESSSQINIVTRAGLSVMSRTTEEGARCLVINACGDVNTHEQYMANGVVRDISRTWAASKEGMVVAEKVFGEVNGILEGVVPGVIGGL